MKVTRNSCCKFKMKNRNFSLTHIQQKDNYCSSALLLLLLFLPKGSTRLRHCDGMTLAVHWQRQYCVSVVGKWLLFAFLWSNILELTCLGNTQRKRKFKISSHLCQVYFSEPSCRLSLKISQMHFQTTLWIPQGAIRYEQQAVMIHVAYMVHNK